MTDDSTDALRVKSEVKPVTQLHDLHELPVYAQPKKLLTTQEAISALLSSDLEESSICTRAPFSIEINAAFIVDLNKFDTPKDVLCDDMGAWIWGGSNKRWISVDSNGFVTFLKCSEDNTCDTTCFRVWKRYYSLKASPDVKKMILLLEGTNYLASAILRCACAKTPQATQTDKQTQTNNQAILLNKRTAPLQSMHCYCHVKVE